MNKKIPWHNFDGDKFQRFCNALLHLEVSKHVQPYTAPGKDGGIDAWYEGPYEGKEGKWRFQAKYHGTESKQAIRSLKSQIKADLENNVRDENYLVFVTNVELLPQKVKEFENLADGYAVELIIWEGGKLQAFVDALPVLYATFVEQNFALKPYKDFFEVDLDKLNLTQSNFHETFVGRDKEFKVLEDFLNDDSRSSISIIGRGGYGKTRLVVEFFKN